MFQVFFPIGQERSPQSKSLKPSSALAFNLRIGNSPRESSNDFSKKLAKKIQKALD